MSPAVPSPQRWALLIGIDFYIPSRDPKSGKTTCHRNLEGCVNDINLVASFLETRLDVAPSRIVKLTSTNSKSSTQSDPPEDPSSWPTRDNIFKAFRDMAMKPPGDLVYIHHSGHGAQVSTAYGRYKGPNALDEALVPADIHINGGQYIRDFEIAGLLQSLVDARLHITLVLDSCHSGSSNRYTKDDGIRGLGKVDCSSLAARVYDVSRDPLDVHGSRKAEFRSSWLLEAQGYVLIAACSSTQKAHEKKFEEPNTSNSTPTSRTHGALTYWLIKSLQEQPNPWSRPLSDLVEVVRARVLGDCPDQSPLLDGMVEIPFFGLSSSNKMKRRLGDPLVKRVDIKSGVLHLDHGRLHGVHVRARYEVYNPDIISPGETKSIVTVTIINADDFECQARIHKGYDIETVKLGFRAKRISKQNSLARVCLVSRETRGSAAREDTWMEKFRRHAGEWKSLDWDLSQDQSDEPPPLFHICQTEAGLFEIQDRSKAPMSNVPRISGDDAKWADKVAACLDHLARFQFVQLLGTTTSSSIKSHCTFRLLGKTIHPPAALPIPQRHNDEEWNLRTSPYDLDSLARIEPVDNIYSVQSREWVLCCFKNGGPKSVYLTFFDFEPKWSITKLYPQGEGQSEEVKSGEERYVPMQMEIQDSSKVIVDTIRAIITKSRTSLDSFELVDIETAVHDPTPPQRGRPIVKGREGETWQVYDIKIRTSSQEH